MLDWMKHKLEIKTSGRNINNLIYADDTILMAESKEELKSLLMKVNEESEKVVLKSTFRKLRSWHLVWQIDGETMETVADFIFLGSISLQMVIAVKLKYACSLKEKL